MKKYILILILISGCVQKPKPDRIAKGLESDINGKYHYVLEIQRNSIPHGINTGAKAVFSGRLNIIQYHLYTNKLGRVKGSDILWGVDSSTPYALSNKSIFIFEKNSVTIKNLQECIGEQECWNAGLDNKYPLVSIDKLSKLKKPLKYYPNNFK